MPWVVTVSEDQFEDVLRAKLGDFWDRAFTLFGNCQRLTFDVTNVLIWAVEKGKAEEVLGLLEQHYEDHLKFQDPEIRGHVTGSLGTNPTQELFLRICREVLELEPDPAE